MERFDHVVVGGGAMGAATAWQLLRRGHSVALIEQFGVAHDRGSSHGGARIFRLAYRNPRYTELAIAALADWRELEAEVGQTLLEQVGQIDHGVATALAQIEDSLTRFGRPVQRLSATEATQRWPGMRFDADVLFSPDGGRVRADDTVRALHRIVVDLGGTVLLNTRVADIEVSGDVAVLTTSAGTFRTQSVVVAAGAWVAGLVAGLVALPPLSIDVGQPTHFQPWPEYADPSLWPSFIHHVVETGPGSVVAGGAYGMWTPGVGFKIGKERPATESIDPDNRDLRIDPAWLEHTRDYVREWFPGLDPDSAQAVTCLFTNRDTSDFLLDRVGPLTVCSPCSGHGFKFVPAIGRLAADLACGGEQAVPEFRLPAH